MSEQPGRWGSGQASGPRTEWRTVMPPKHWPDLHQPDPDPDLPPATDVGPDPDEPAEEICECCGSPDGEPIVAMTLDRLPLCADCADRAN